MIDSGGADTPAAKTQSITPAFAYDLPNLPGQKVTGVLVEYAPGGSSRRIITPAKERSSPMCLKARSARR